MKRKALAGLVAGILLIPGSPVQAASAAPAITFGPCADATLAAGGAECGTLAVPLDPAVPGGARITLAVSRVRHTVPDAEYRGVVLVAPNPLGGIGYRQSLLGARVPGGAGARYDWVSFAARGLTPSVPAVTCVPDYFGYDRPPYVPTTPAIEARWRAKTAAYADACATDQPGLLAHMRTTDTAADLDRIRAAIGADRVTVFAQSYGTYNAEVYATLYPQRVRGMVLDSVVNPARVWYDAAALDPNLPLERNLLLWFDWLARNDSVLHLGATRDAVRRVWDAQLALVTRQPIESKIGFDEFIDVFLVSPYFQSSWPLLGSALSGWVNRGDGATLVALFDAFYPQGSDNTYGAMLGQLCTDAPWPADYATWRADSDRSHAQAPYSTWGNTWFNLPCATWHAPAGQPVRVTGAGVPSALLIDETLDAATPFEGALEVRARTPNASLVAVRGGINNGAALSGNACVDDAIAAYLATGARPARLPGRTADRLCAPPPDPVPLG